MKAGIFGRSAVGAAALSFAVCLPITSQAQTNAPDVPAPSAQFTAAQTAFDAAWTAESLSFSTATYADGEATAYGNYAPRASSQFSIGEAITIYAEPVGYSFAEDGDGYAYDLDVGFRLLNSTGQVLVEQQGFAKFSGKSRSKRRELGASLSFAFEGLPAGSYVLTADFNDKIGGKGASLSLPLTVVNGQ
ncbi:hypothetical protein [Roseibium sp.]|uniref:hypothetical protein n=1 Tax=Roseibium sp. TaxID=1936156 RepID=UPI003A96F88F